MRTTVKSITCQYMSSLQVVVVVDDSTDATKLISAAVNHAYESESTLTVLYAIRNSKKQPVEKNSINQVLINMIDANVVHIDSKQIAQQVLAYLRTNPVSTLFISRFMEHSWQKWLFKDLSNRIKTQYKNINVCVTGTPHNDTGRSWLNHLIGYAICIIVVSLLTVILHLIQHLIAEADIMMAYLAVVVILAYYLNRGPTLFAAFFSVAAFDFFFVSPFYTFAVDHEKYLISFAVMATVGFLFSSYSERAKQQLRESKAREVQLRDLYHLARSLAAVSSNEEIAKLTCFQVTVATGIRTGFFQKTNQNIELTEKTGIPNDHEFSENKASQCIKVQNEITVHKSEEIWSYYPIGPKDGLVLICPLEKPLTHQQHHLIQTYLSLSKLAITRSLLSEQASAAKLHMESEQLRNAILSAVSHDLRTPLATIMGMTSTLLDKNAKFDELTTFECLNTIYDLSEQLSQKVTNLLQMSRNLRGKLIPKIELQNPEEFVGATLAKMTHRLQNHQIEIDLDDTLLIPMDVFLMEVVLSNLLDNAVKFSNPQSTIKIFGKHQQSYYVLSVKDQGIGLNNCNYQHLFEHFYTMHQNVSSTGLGLAISQAIVEAHGGRISGRNADQGAIFIIEIPVRMSQED